MESDRTKNCARFKKLGFIPQKEIVYNKVLPYTKELDDESQRLLAEIKGNLAKSVMLKEIKPGCATWATRLQKYIKMFGLKFSKEDHITFVKLMYELVMIPDLEPYLVHKFSNVFTLLLKKRELIKPEELTLEWRPMYDLCDRILGRGQSIIGMYRYFSSLEASLNNFIHAAKPYFSLSATKEMLDYWRPKLCPFDHDAMLETIACLEVFLPITLPPEKSELGYKLWLDELMELWKICHNAPGWEREMMSLIAHLAYNNIGYIDWEPHIPLMFSRFLRSFNLPVQYKQAYSSKKPKIDTGCISYWIVATLGGKSSTQKYLDKFMKALESYYHPANTGRWIMKLKEFLQTLPLYFIQRLHKERYKKLTWETPVPESHKLTEDDITRFVECMKPVVMTAMFTRLDSSDVSQAMQHLATLRPALIIPPLIEKLYCTLDSLTEPHKYTAAMQCVVAVARPMVQGTDYAEGPTHVVPLLLASLPGIDPNDIRKCFVTFQFITTFSTMVPLVDSSAAPDYYNDLTPEEESTSLGTAQFEDFILQFLDRCFLIIDSSVLEVTRLERDADKRSKLENMVESALASTCSAIITQTSSRIFESALQKLYSFVTGRILETKVAGRFVAAICRTFAKARPEETLKMFVPHLCHTIITLIESDDVLKEEIVDNELLYNMLLLAEVINCRGDHVLQYSAMLERILDRTLHMTCKEGFTLASQLLHNMLSIVSRTWPTEYRSTTEDYDKHVSQYLPVRDWGKPGNLQNLKITWDAPGDTEVKYAQHIISKYLPSEIERLQDYINDKLTLTREELHCSLGILIGLLGCGPMLPMWDEVPLTLADSSLDQVHFQAFAGIPGEVRMPDGTNVRKSLVSIINSLQAKLLSFKEDDTKSFFYIIRIWNLLMLNSNHNREEFEMHWKAFHCGKKVLENKLLGGKHHLRGILVDRALLQHEVIQSYASIMPTETHKNIILSLLELATSRYSEVRIKAQGKLFSMIDYFPFLYLVLIPPLVDILKMDSNEFHEQLKGALYVLLGPKQHPICTRRDWKMLTVLWPAIVHCKPSEKMSINKLLETLSGTVHKHFPTITINMKVPDPCISIAKSICESCSPSPVCEVPSPDQMIAANAQLETSNEKSLKNYQFLLESLADAIKHSNLHWRFHSLALCFLRDLVHPDHDYPPRIVETFLHTLIHDSLELRKVATRCTVFLLKQQKRDSVKEVVNLKVESMSVEYGDRPDNAWLQYSKETSPNTEEEWDKTRYSYKVYVGYYTWPKELMLHSASSKQPKLDREFAELSPAEQEVDKFFSDPKNIDQLIKFLSLEEKKGKDKFNGFRFIMFKNLFRNHGDKHLALFVPHLERLVADKQESSQRCAAEIIAGMIRGAKLWPFDKVKHMWEILLPILRTAFANMTEETVTDWSVFAATSAKGSDPNRQHWLLEFLMENPIRQEASFLDCGRLCALQAAINQHQWRVAELFHRLLDYIHQHLSHPFQNIRDRIGSVLVNIFDPDLPIQGRSCTVGPHIRDFLADVLPQLACLYSIPANNNHILHSKDGNGSMINSVIDKKIDAETCEIEVLNHKLKNLPVECSEETRDEAIRLLKTIAKYMMDSLLRVQYSALPEFFGLMPLVAIMESYEADEELKKTCKWTMASLAQSLTLPEYIPAALQAVHQISEMSSWWARTTSLDFLQVFVFHNMAVICSNDSWIEQVNSLVLRLLQDERVEVREKAGEVLSGLLHCNFVTDTKKLLFHFKKLASLRKKVRTEGVTKVHAGVLGLCAFISANPYDVPEHIPEIFQLLGPHLSDPQPIPSTIRKTLGDFKRTHHDNWSQHKLCFSEEQLAVLSDLTIPPSYYA